MISKELLSEVLKQETRFIRYVANNTYEVHFEKPIRLKYIIINIYELAHKCKEWAFANGYYLTIYNDAIDVVLQSNCKILENVTNDTFMYDPNLVFKACQWILDNKEIK